MKIYKVLLIFLLLVVFVIANVLLFARFLRLGNEPLYALLLLAGINLNLLALLVLAFYVGKNILRLYIDKKKNIPGQRFQIQLVSIFVILTLIPGLFLFIIGSGLVTGYVERWLTPQGLRSLEDSLKLARSYYEEKRLFLEVEGRRLIEKGIGGSKFVQQGLHNERWEIVSDGKTQLLLSSPERINELIKEALSKGEATEVLKGADGEYIALALALKDKERQVLLGTYKVPPEITETIEGLKDEYEEAIINLKWKFPLRINFILTFGFFTLLIIMLALWAGLRISKKITEPVRELTEATMEVASGNLDVKIKREERNDEIGYLIRNFNTMIEELRESKKRLQETFLEAEGQRLRLSSILANINTGVLSINHSGIIMSMNRAAERILGISQEEFTGRHYREMIAYTGSEELESLIKGISLKDLKGIEREIRLNLKERSLILRVFIAALRMPEEGPIIGLIVVFDDITDIVNAQRTLAWQEIAVRIAHEVKNPLTPIKLSTERLIKKWKEKDSDFNEVFESSTRTIIREVESLRQLVSDFSQFGRMPQIKKKVVDMREIMRELYNLYTGFKDIRFHFDLPPHAIVAEIDPEQIKRVFINIVDNAIEAINGINGSERVDGVKGNIYIRLFLVGSEKTREESDEKESRVVVSIADDGPGVPDEIKDKLFMPHFTTRKGGSGLGLAIANRIIREHRGVIKIRDNVPKGALFIIELPSGMIT